MPELPRISGRKAVQVFERMGFVRARQRGSRVVLRRGGVGCVVPLHKSLAIGTLRSAIRQAGIKPDEFIGAHEGK